MPLRRHWRIELAIQPVPTEVIMNSLLLEIGTEEIPAGYIQPALDAMTNTLRAKLLDARIGHGQFRTYATPRRLAVRVDDVAAKQRSITEQVMGPPEKVAFDADGHPTVAAIKFAEKIKTSVDKLAVEQTPKGRYLSAKVTERGRSSITLLKEILPQVILAIPFPKTMKWGDLHLQFARPVHYIMALLGPKVIGFQLENLKSGRYTKGHYFMHPQKIKIASPDDYLPALKAAKVIADMGPRRQAISADVEKAAAQAGGAVLPDEPLLDIVTNLVESTYAVVGRFDEEYLEVPDEVLITAMREHQKYFAIVDDQGRLMPCFIAVNNTLARDMDLVAQGHERVIRARLADAQFFYRSDLGVPSDERVEKLKGVLFQAKLGTMHAKTLRIQALAEFIASTLRHIEPYQDQAQQLGTWASRAAWLSKSDLVSQMVGEFPKLQGIMGRVYALKAGEPNEVGLAVEEHYRPLHSGAALPQTLTGALVSIADKLDSICGCFSVGLIPTGAADPYALRRQGIGAIQIMLDKNFTFSLKALIEKALALYDINDDQKIAAMTNDIYRFLKRRITSLLAEEGFSKDVIVAVADTSIDNIPHVWARVRTLEKLKAQPDFEPIAIAFKRVVNIIKKAGQDRVTAVDIGLFEDKSEKMLFDACQDVSQKVAASLSRGNFESALHDIASLREPVDAFFEGVMVMADDPTLRTNRLALLGSIAALFDNFADFSKITT
jgi:glycyl-tRNA synthetase beta chain